MELLISLALIGLMVALLFGALRFSSKSWDVSEERLERDTSITMLWQYLADRFRETRHLTAHVQAEGETHHFFEGEAQGVEFVTLMPAHLGSGGLYIVRIVQATVDGKQKLILQRWLYHPEVLEGKADIPEWRPLSSSGRFRSGLGKPELRAWYSESVLVDELKKVRFSYYGIQEKGDEQAQWSEHWEAKKARLPFLVRLQVMDDRGEWPEMIFDLPGGF